LGARAKDLIASERWRFVAFGDAVGVQGAFGVDAAGAILFLTGATKRHS
jgi:hypothetical protein